MHWHTGRVLPFCLKLQAPGGASPDPRSGTSVSLAAGILLPPLSVATWPRGGRPWPGSLRPLSSRIPDIALEDPRDPQSPQTGTGGACFPRESCAIVLRGEF